MYYNRPRIKNNIRSKCFIYTIIYQMHIFDPTSKQEIKEKQGVLLENSNGKLMISKETIENLVESVAKDFKEAESITTRVELDKENNVSIFANLVVSADAVIKDLSADLQNK